MSGLNLFWVATAAKQGLKQVFKPSITSKLLATTIGAAALTLVASSAQAASFMGLGNLAGESSGSFATSVSADGSTVVGWSGSEAFRWTATDGMVGLGDLINGDFRSRAEGVSADGSVVVGWSDSVNASSEAFRWTAANGMVGLGGLIDSSFFSQARDVSADGSVVVGGSTSANGFEAFRWTATDGMVGLGDLPNGPVSSIATGVSADGSVVSGSGRSNLGRETFRWTATDGMVNLGDLPNGLRTGFAEDISADGSTIVGTSFTTGPNTEAFRWTVADGMVSLGNGSALGVSADGSIVVGSNGSRGPFIWDNINGRRLLSDVLINDFRLNITGWQLGAATAISDDGLTIVGSGQNPSRSSEAWIARLDCPLGTCQDNPILPNRIGPRVFDFDNVPRGQWYDPPAAFGFEYTMTSDSLFTQILNFPIGIDADDLFTVTAGDTVLGEFGAGQSVDFVSLLGSGVSSFTITGIDPLVDGSDPTAFPLQLDFNTPTASFEMRALASTPEPSTFLGLSTIALAGGTLLRRKRKA